MSTQSAEYWGDKITNYCQAVNSKLFKIIQKSKLKIIQKSKLKVIQKLKIKN